MLLACSTEREFLRLSDRARGGDVGGPRCPCPESSDWTVIYCSRDWIWGCIKHNTQMIRIRGSRNSSYFTVWSSGWCLLVHPHNMNTWVMCFLRPQKSIFYILYFIFSHFFITRARAKTLQLERGFANMWNWLKVWKSVIENFNSYGALMTINCKYVTVQYFIVCTIQSIASQSFNNSFGMVCSGKLKETKYVRQFRKYWRKTSRIIPSCVYSIASHSYDLGRTMSSNSHIFSMLSHIEYNIYVQSPLQ